MNAMNKTCNLTNLDPSLSILPHHSLSKFIDGNENQISESKFMAQDELNSCEHKK